jgi:hypothetical protein
MRVLAAIVPLALAQTPPLAEAVRLLRESKTQEARMALARAPQGDPEVAYTTFRPCAARR